MSPAASPVVLARGEPVVTDDRWLRSAVSRRGATVRFTPPGMLSQAGCSSMRTGHAHERWDWWTRDGVRFRWVSRPCPIRDERACDQALSHQSGGGDLNSRPLRPEVRPGELERCPADGTAGRAPVPAGCDPRRWNAIAGWTRDAGTATGGAISLVGCAPAVLAPTSLGGAAPPPEPSKPALGRDGASYRRVGIRQDACSGRGRPVTTIGADSATCCSPNRST